MNQKPKDQKPEFTANEQIVIDFLLAHSRAKKLIPLPAIGTSYYVDGARVDSTVLDGELTVNVDCNIHVQPVLASVFDRLSQAEKELASSLKNYEEVKHQTEQAKSALDKHNDAERKRTKTGNSTVDEATIQNGQLLSEVFTGCQTNEEAHRLRLEASEAEVVAAKAAMPEQPSIVPNKSATYII